MRIIILILIFSTGCTAQPYFGRLVVAPATDTSLNNANIIADGNSYFTNYGGPICSPNVLITLSPFATNGTTISNFGVNGQTTGQMFEDVSTQIIPLYDASKINIAIITEGINDLHQSGNVDSAVNRMVRYCNMLKSAGFYVVLATAIKISSVPNYLTDAYNEKIITHSNSYDILIRPDLDNIFSSYSSGGYQSDNVHPNQIGHNKYAELWKAAILNL